MKAKEYLSMLGPTAEESIKVLREALAKEFEDLKKKRCIKTKDGWGRLYDEFLSKAAIIAEKSGQNIPKDFFSITCDI